MAKNKIILSAIFLGCVIFFAQDLSRHGIEYRDDEIFYFNSTREMVQSGNYLSPTYFGEDRFQKPILFYWLIILSYKLFGTTWFGARFVAVVFAALSVCLTWSIAREFFDRKTAAVSSLVLMTIPLFFRHAKNAVPDMVLNFFIVLSLYCVLKFFQSPERKRWGIFFFAACACGFMIKGFAAIVIPFLTVIAYTLWLKRAELLKKMNFPRGLLVMAVLILPWFFYMAAVHGAHYTEYVLKAETLNRMVAPSDEHGLLKFAITFKKNSMFYLKTLLSYFAPWSIFAVAAIPLSWWAARREKDKRGKFLFLNIWFFATFLFFSLIFARINHLVLVLTTPFAMLVGWFLLRIFDSASWGGRALNFFRKFLTILVVAAGCIGLVVLRVFLAGSSPLWLAFFLLLLVSGLIVIIRSRRPFPAALSLGLFLVFTYSQTGLVSQAGLTSHSTLQRIAQGIDREMDVDSVIGVGSHDIHEKELQVYFDRKVEKAATSDETETRGKLQKLFATPGEVLCVMTEKDYDRFLKDSGFDRFELITEDFIARRRMRLDEGFFTALLRLDREKVRDYLMEKIILVRKDKNA